jgi:tetratricopeptide (TPR) repeat protein
MAISKSIKSYISDKIQDINDSKPTAIFEGMLNTNQTRNKQSNIHQQISINKHAKESILKTLMSNLNISVQKQNSENITDFLKLKEMFTSNSFIIKIEEAENYISDLENMLNSICSNSALKWIYEFVEYLNQIGPNRALEYLSSQNLIKTINNKPYDTAILHFIKAYMFLINSEIMNAKKSFLLSLDSYVFFENLFYFANFLVKNGELSKAIWRLKYINQKIDMTTHQSAIFNSLYGLLLYQNQQPKDSIEHYLTSIEKYTQLSIDDIKYKENIILEQQNLAKAYKNLKEYKLAKTTYDNTLKHSKELSGNISEKNRLIIGDTLSDIASIWHIQNKTAEAKDIYQLALNFYLKHTIDDNDDKAIYKTSISIKKIGDIYNDQKNHNNTLENYKSALELLENISNKNPAKYLKDVAIVKNLLADMYITKKDVANAIIMLNDSLKIQQSIYSINKDIKPIDIAKTISLLTACYMQIKRTSEAEISAKQYVQYCKKMSLNYPKDFLPLVADAKTILGRILLQQNKYAESEIELSAALMLRKKLSKSNVEKNFYEIANILDSIGHLNANKKNFVKSEINFKASVQYKNKLAQNITSQYAASYLMSVSNLSYSMIKNDKKIDAINALSDSINICKKVIENKIQNAYMCALKILQSHYNLKKSSKIASYIKALADINRHNKIFQDAKIKIENSEHKG